MANMILYIEERTEPLKYVILKAVINTCYKRKTQCTNILDARWCQGPLNAKLVQRITSYCVKFETEEIQYSYSDLSSLTLSFI